MDVRVTGAAELAAAFRRAADEASRLDFSDAGDLVRSQLEASSPRLTGQLAGSWTVQPGDGRVEVGSDLVYAAVQNYGSHHVPALQYVDRAVELTTDDAGRLITADIDRLISRF